MIDYHFSEVIFQHFI